MFPYVGQSDVCENTSPICYCVAFTLLSTMRRVFVRSPQGTTTSRTPNILFPFARSSAVTPVTHLQEATNSTVILPVRVERHLRQPGIANNPAVGASRENPCLVLGYVGCVHVADRTALRTLHQNARYRRTCNTIYKNLKDKNRAQNCYARTWARRSTARRA